MKSTFKIYLAAISAVMVIATAVLVAESVGVAAIAIWPALGLGYLTKLLVNKLQ